MPIFQLLGLSPIGRLHPDTRSFRDRILANGGTISTSALSVVNVFVKDTYTKGLRDRVGSNHKIVDCCPMVGDNLLAAQVKLWYPPGVSDKLTLVNVVSGNYSPSTGIQMDGTSKYGRTGVIPSTHLGSNAGFSVVLRNDTAGATRVDIGTYQTTTQSFLLYSRLAGDTLSFDAYNRTSVANATSKARWVCSVNAGTQRVYKDGNLLTTGTQTSTTAPTTEIYVGGVNGASQFSDRLFAYYDLNIGLTASEATSWDATIASMMTALGRVG